MPGPRPANLKQLRESGWRSRPVKQELRENMIAALVRAKETGEPLFPGIVGYDDTVIPEIVNAVLAGHDMLFLGEKGQAKSRLMRLLARFLDPEIPYLDVPRAVVGGVGGRRSTRIRTSRSPAPARNSSPPPTNPRSRSGGGRVTSVTPSGSPPAPSSPTSSVRSTPRGSPRAPACRWKNRSTSA